MNDEVLEEGVDGEASGRNDNKEESAARREAEGGKESEEAEEDEGDGLLQVLLSNVHECEGSGRIRLLASVDVDSDANEEEDHRQREEKDGTDTHKPADDDSPVALCVEVCFRTNIREWKKLAIDFQVVVIVEALRTQIAGAQGEDISASMNTLENDLQQERRAYQHQHYNTHSLFTRTIRHWMFPRRSGDCTLQQHRKQYDGHCIHRHSSPCNHVRLHKAHYNTIKKDKDHSSDTQRPNC